MAARSRPKSRPSGGQRRAAGRRHWSPGGARYRPRPQAAGAPRRLATGRLVPACVALLLGLPVAFRGLYFPPQQLLAVVGACAVAALVWWARRPEERAFLREGFDMAALSLAGAYLVSVTVAVDPEAAVQSVLLRLLYFLAFWCAAEAARCFPLGRRVVSWGLLLGGAIVALSGVAAASGALSGHGFFLDGRMYTSIQYPDAAAAYLAAVAFVALGLQAGEERRLAGMLYAVASGTFLFAFVFALSRGATLVFAPAACAFVVAQGRGRRADAALALGGGLAAVGAGALPYLRGIAAVAAGHRFGAVEVWVGLLVAWVVAAGVALAWRWWRSAATRPRVAAGAVAAAVAVAALGGAWLHLRHHSGSLLGRLGHLSLADYNAWSRLQWTRDAMRLVARHPVLGLGGGGWAAAYRAVQSYPYTSTQVHNGWVQTWVSVGTVGLACWCAFWAFLAWAAWRAWRRADASERPLVTGLAVGCAVLGAHSALDFTLSLGGISVGLWGMAGLLRAAGAGPPSARAAAVPGRRRGRPAGAGLAALGGWGFSAGVTALAIFALVLWTGGRRMEQGARLADLGQDGLALRALQAAAADVPWSATTWFDLAQVETALAGQGGTGPVQQQAALRQADADYRRALALDPYGYLTYGQARTFYGFFLQRVGQPGQALAQFRQALADGPYVASNYDTLDLAIIDQAVAQARAHEVAAGRRTLQELAAVARRRALMAARVPAPAKAAVKTGQVPAFPASDAGMRLAAGEAAAMEGRWAAAESLLAPLEAQPASIGGEAALWLGLVQARTGRAAAAALRVAAQDLGSSYQQQYQLVGSVVGALQAPPARGGRR